MAASYTRVDKTCDKVGLRLRPKPISKTKTYFLNGFDNFLNYFIFGRISYIHMTIRHYIEIVYFYHNIIHWAVK